MKLSVFRSRSVLAAVAVMASVPLTLAAQSKVPHFPTPGTDPAQPTLAPLPETPAITPDGTVVEDVIVRVNDQVISRTDLERAREQLMQEAQQQQLSAADARERQNNLLRDLIDKQLLLSKGKELGINPDADVVRQLDEIRKQNHMDSMDDLEKAARAQGVSFEDFKDSIRTQLITSQVVRDEVGRTIHMTESDERKFYEAHKDMFAQPESIRLSEILVPAPAEPSTVELDAARKKADQVEAELKAGGKFAELAKKYSGGPTASQGGDLGEFKRGGLAKVLEDATFGLKAGEFTQPIRTRQGFVILQVTEHQAAGTPPLSEIEGQVQQAMYSEQMGPALRAYLTKLRENAYIKMQPGFVDTGASPNQTTPTYSAYTPPAPKKKKEETKARYVGRMQQQQHTAPQMANATVELDKNGKPKKLKREKIRYGQAPRVALPTSPDEETAVAPVQEAAPGTAIAPTLNENTVNVAENPLDATAAPKPKTRYSHEVVEVKQKKAQDEQRKVAEKIAATPEGPSKQEQLANKIQSAPLGATKEKKKHKKGDPKERLQEKEPEKAAPLKQNPYPDKNTGMPVEDKKPTQDQQGAPAPAPAPTNDTKPAPSN